jgi:DNA repair protein RadA/Sms
MSKVKANRTVYVCGDCGEEYTQWQGKCASCGAWNTLKEISVATERVAGGYSGATAIARQNLGSIAATATHRTSSGIHEFDRVLGGGIVPGSVILLGGDPGIGKSTLLLQIAETLPGMVLYCSGEESPEQIKLRADRLGITGGAIELFASTDVGSVIQQIEQTKPALVVIDSIQTMYDPAYPSTPGSLVQVRETAIRLQQTAKRIGIPLVLVGHITKEGTIAGPRTLEHLVDVVLYLEGDPQHQLRVLRAVKNRFGDSSETGLFTMEEKGLLSVENAGSFLLQERLHVPGSALAVVLEGSRPVLIEVQALVSRTTFGNPRRTSSGFDGNRLNLLLAVLQRRAGVDLSAYDVFVNIVGGLKSKDPGIDAAVCVALASALTEKTVPMQAVISGEVGLAGEVRKATQSERRRKEAVNLGYTPILEHPSVAELLRAVFTASPTKQSKTGAKGQQSEPVA